jgi:hypothetical protein
MDSLKNLVGFLGSLKKPVLQKPVKSDFQIVFERWLTTNPGSESEENCIKMLRIIPVDSEEAFSDLFMAYVRIPENSSLKDILEKRLEDADIKIEYWFMCIMRAKFMPRIIRLR